MGTEAPEKKNVAPFTASIQSPLRDPISAGTYLGGVDHPLPVQLLADWRYKGQGPTYIKVGRLIRYRKAALDAWLQSREVAVKGA
jgi:hypothetical protein